MISNFNTLRLLKPDQSIGAYDPRLTEDYGAINRFTSDSDIIVFTKPLVINLKCDRNSYALNKRTNEEALTTNYYFLIPRDKRLKELYSLNSTLKGPIGDTIFLKYFYLVRNVPAL